MTQTSYSANSAVARAGLEGDLRTNYKVDKINGESSAIPFGIWVTRGASENKAALLSKAADEVIGCVVATMWTENQALSNADGVAAAESMSVMHDGSIWVKVEETVAAGDDVFVRFATGSGTQIGASRKSADSGTCRKLHGAKYEVGASTNGYALVVFDGIGHETEDHEILYFDHAQAADVDRTDKLFKTPSDRYFVITGVDYVNPTGLAAHADNHALIQVLNGSTVAAGWNTDADGTTNGIGATAAAEGALDADTTVAFTLNTLANRTVPPSTQVSLKIDESGTTTVPAGRVALHGYWL